MNQTKTINRALKNLMRTANVVAATSVDYPCSNFYFVFAYHLWLLRLVVDIIYFLLSVVIHTKPPHKTLCLLCLKF